jgi:hypothetical protein
MHFSQSPPPLPLPLPAPPSVGTGGGRHWGEEKGEGEFQTYLIKISFYITEIYFPCL